jgi:hypothetical protein
MEKFSVVRKLGAVAKRDGKIWRSGKVGVAAKCDRKIQRSGKTWRDNR